MKTQIKTQQLIQHTFFNLSNLNQKFQQLNFYYHTNQHSPNLFIDLETGEIYQLIEIQQPYSIYILQIF